MGFITFIIANKVVVLSALLGISELLALTPLKSNGIFHFLYNQLAKVTNHEQI